MSIRRLAFAALVFSVNCQHAAPSAPSPSQLGVDVLDYVVGNTSLWPRVGSHSQNQVVDLVKQEVCWVKYANPRTFECWRWDDDFLYHVVDHAIDGNTGESYRFSDGRWMPRRLTGNWSLDVAANQITWFDAGCRTEAAKSGVFPYRLRAWVDGAHDAGPDLGTRATLVLEYQPYDPAGSAGVAEYFYFARGAGWYEWDRESVRDMFSRVGGPARTPARDTVCGGS